MKILNYIVSLALTGLFSLTTLNAEDWQTLLPNQSAAPEWSAGALMADPYDISPTPGVFVGAFTETVGAATIHYVSPDGHTQSVDNNLARVFSLAESNGAIYAGGFRYAGVYQTWVVRESTDGGVSWTDSDPLPIISRRHSSARGIVAAPDGRVYVCGSAQAKNGSYRWVVRVRNPDSSWSSAYDQVTRGESMASGMAYFPGEPGVTLPALFAAGIDNGKWTVIRSFDGQQWTTVDSWAPPKASATATAIVNSGKDIYVVGFRGSSLSPTGWVIRKSTDGGTTFSEALFRAESANSWAMGAAVDAAGTIRVVGMTGTHTGNQWTVLKNFPGQPWDDSWNNRDLPYLNAGYRYTKARAVAADATGNSVYVAGELAEATASKVGLQRLQSEPPSEGN